MAWITRIPSLSHAGMPADAARREGADRSTTSRVRRVVLVVALLALALCPSVARAATFTPTDTPGLIAAINAANTNGVDDIIDLDGRTFTLTAADNAGAFGGSNGLPIIAEDGGNTLTIRNGTIRRDGGPSFRIIEVASGATLELEDVTISGGDLPASAGGGIFNFGTLTLTDSTISDNSALQGGGIFTTGTVIMTDSTVSGNSGPSGGGGIFNQSGTVTVTASTISGNDSFVGGGIGNSGGALTITNSTVSGNSGGQGGGIANIGGITSTVTLGYSTLSGNTAFSGGAIYNGTGTVSLRAVLLDTGATGPNCDRDARYGTFSSLGSNVADDATCFSHAGTDKVVADGALLLGPLADNGGPTETHALLAGSPAADAVKGACDVATDQRGIARPLGSACDAGAFERKPDAHSGPDQGSDDSGTKKNTNDDKPSKETEEQRQQRQRTDTSNKDDVATEGNVMEVHPEAAPPYVVIANRDGLVKVVLLGDAAKRAGDIRVGDYLTVEGEKQHEHLYEATDVSVKRGR